MMLWGKLFEEANSGGTCAFPFPLPPAQSTDGVAILRRRGQLCGKMEGSWVPADPVRPSLLHSTTLLPSLLM